MPEAVMPRARASLANSLFHASKPADVLPHCAALASPAIATNANKVANVTTFKSLDLATETTTLAPPAASVGRSERNVRVRSQGRTDKAHRGTPASCHE